MLAAGEGSLAEAGKIALVTGASSGIGRAIASHLAAGGWRVFGTSRGGAGIGDVGVEMLALDVDDDAAVAAAVAAVMARAGRIDALVNNAGWALMGAVEDTSPAEARAQMETNFFGVFRLCRAVLPIMRAQGGGHIVNISSLAGLFGAPYSGFYSASKAAVEALTEALRLETRRFGIRAVLVEPGDFRTDLAQRRRTAAAAAGSAYEAAFRRVAAAQAADEATAPAPERVARLVARILATPDPRARYTVGMPVQRLVAPLKRFLPHAAFEAILRAALKP
jgi:NAD(P)-dependent dehydrogenase (short-subunit alcohol dehydrogenase family)